ncbi:MAG: ShlB/FhaC/HecB family hemolysin secretion/activation protein [Betaproteobacteria bacterium]|nr:ShlB/FhaC/HecB family hemolysin secretion/activation protein [Betaproteobacteria bacterium]
MQQRHISLRWLRRLAFALGVLAASPVLFAQSAPPSGADNAIQELLRQQERERALREQMEQTPDVRLERPRATAPGALPANETPCFHIERIALAGDMAERFQWALAAADPAHDPAIGRCLGAAGINIVMARVQNAIVARGYVTTRVLAAPQDLKSGTLTLSLIPGRLRAIRFSDDSSPLATQANTIPTAPGRILNLRDIEQALENYKRLPSAEADIQIAPAEGKGAQPGESDLIVRWRQAFPLRLTLAADDAGSKATGKYQGSATFSFDNPFTLNDLFYFSYNHDLGGGDPGSRGSEGFTAHYSIPFGYSLLGFTTSNNTYHQAVAGANQTYIYRGTSQNSEVKLSHVLYRDAARRIGAWLRGWMRESKNYIDDTEIEVQRRRMAGWEIGLTQREFIGPATLDLALGYRHGTGAMSALTAPEEAFGEGSSQPKLGTADAQLTLPFALAGQRLRYTANWRAQWNETPLVPQDRFSIGNRYTVRGFDGETTLIGERGWLIRNDLGLALGQSGQEIYLGLDYGRVDGPSTDYLLGRELAGAVIGLRGGYRGLSWDVFLGRPIAKPEHFRAASTTGGFNLSWTL